MANFPYSHIVCKCNHVSLGEIMYAIEYKGATTISSIQQLTDAGTTCGCCISKEFDVNEKKLDLYLTQILNKFNNESTNK
jgi:NAD(P)H-nitrite reductase large subunit